MKVRFGWLEQPRWLRAGVVVCLALALTRCGSDSTTPGESGFGGGNGSPTEPPPTPSTPEPVPPPPEPVPPPEPPPPPPPPPGAPVHEGIPFGFAQAPPEKFGEYSATIHNPAGDPVKLMRDLDTARAHSTRVWISFTGNEENLRNGNGFDIEKWKARTDRFRELDLTPYIADGTLLGNYVMDEPEDKANWDGIRVPPETVEEIAAYSKSIWPTLPTMVRTPPTYLEGHDYSALDAARVQYLDRFAPADSFIPANIEAARKLGLALVGGLNVLNGGDGSSGIPGRKEGKFAMGPDEIRTFGKKFLAEPYICAFIIFEYDEGYLARPGIREAIAELAEIARTLPKKECRR